MPRPRGRYKLTGAGTSASACVICANNDDFVATWAGGENQGKCVIATCDPGYEVTNDGDGGTVCSACSDSEQVLTWETEGVCSAATCTAGYQTNGNVGEKFCGQCRCALACVASKSRWAGLPCALRAGACDPCAAAAQLSRERGHLGCWQPLHNHQLLPRLYASQRPRRHELSSLQACGSKRSAVALALAGGELSS